MTVALHQLATRDGAPSGASGAGTFKCPPPQSRAPFAVPNLADSAIFFWSFRQICGTLCGCAPKRKSVRRPSRPASAPRAVRQRKRLIDACISALHIHGPSRTTVEKVVAIAGMSPGIVRFYFDSKAAMLVASLQYLATEFEERLLVPVAQLKDRPVRALETLVDLYLDPDIASPRKVSVWYSFWGEASSRQEYLIYAARRMRASPRWCASSSSG